MVQEAEEFAEEDKLTKKRIDARNGLEGYCYNLKNQMSDESEKGLGDKVSEDDKKSILEAVEEVIDWLDENQEAELEEYEEQQKDLEAIVNPIMENVYQQAGAGGGADDEDDDWGEDDFDEL